MPKTNAERQAAWAARNTKTWLVLPDDAKAQLAAYIERQRQRGETDISMGSVLARLIRTQLARKR